MAITALIVMPGFDRVSAQSVIAEIGPDMKPFPGSADLSHGLIHSKGE
jgi:hypothetical protein